MNGATGYNLENTKGYIDRVVQIEAMDKDKQKEGMYALHLFLKRKRK